MNYLYNTFSTDIYNKYTNEEFSLLDKPPPVFNKVYKIDDVMIQNKISSLRKTALPRKNKKFTPTDGVLGELDIYFKKNNIIY